MALLLVLASLLLTGCGGGDNKDAPAGNAPAGDAPAAAESGAFVSSVKAGEIVTFGKYEQDNEEGNGGEPIEWLVLQVQGSRAMLISRYALEKQAFETDSFKEPLTWENCQLRKWLNGEFFSAAFSAEEQAAIPAVKVKCAAEDGLGWSPEQGNDTEDRVYLLSLTEARDLFADNEARRCVPTSYAWDWGYPEEYFDAEGRATVRWWTRSLAGETAGRIDLDGDYDGSNVPYDVTRGSWVRPVIWVDLASGLITESVAPDAGSAPAEAPEEAPEEEWIEEPYPEEEWIEEPYME